LWGLTQDSLRRTQFPLAQMTKSEVRALALRHGLRTAGKRESFEICFVTDNSYERFLKQMRPELESQVAGGDIVLDGKTIGKHRGYPFYTIGQRKGLGLSSAKPLYVIELDAARNRVMVGDDAALARDEFVAEQCNWIAFDTPAATFQATVKIRYNHPGTPATMTPLGRGTVKVKLHVPQRAITPGQAAVFYQEDVVLGGGWISCTVRTNAGILPA
ncbi:MAG: aminomethyltransferase beta-barrel domain-containing protein, partial [Verrucomicrobiota bacterium]